MNLVSFISISMVKDDFQDLRDENNVVLLVIKNLLNLISIRRKPLVFLIS